MTAPLVLIDLSSIIHPLWHQSGSEPDPNWTSIQTVAKVRALASGQPHVGICVDGPRSRAVRQAIDPTYKAQRDTAPEALFHQARLAIETLRGDGFPIWEAEGYEADDVIASAAVRASEGMIKVSGQPSQDMTVLIVTADKDLCQLVSDRVTIKHALKGDVLDVAGVVAKFGVRPDQIGDYLALCGDTSDNIKGAKGIGAVRAAALLAKHGTLATILTPAVADAQTPAVKESLYEFGLRADAVRSLVALRTDVPVEIAAAFTERVPTEAEMAETMDEMDKSGEALNKLAEPITEEAKQAFTAKVMDAARATEQALVPHVVPAPAPAEWSMQLEPRSMADAWTLAQHLHQSRLFSAYGTPSAVLSTILAGRELGLQAMASLRAFHIIEGRPTLSAGIIQALVLKSPDCEYFRCTERTNLQATFETKRKGNPPMSLTFTLDDAKMAWSKGDTEEKRAESFKKSGYGKNPADMCVARAATKLARLVYADVVNNLYAPEEFA